MNKLTFKERIANHIIKSNCRFGVINAFYVAEKIIEEYEKGKRLFYIEKGEFEFVLDNEKNITWYKVCEPCNKKFTKILLDLSLS